MIKIHIHAISRSLRLCAVLKRIYSHGIVARLRIVNIQYIWSLVVPSTVQTSHVRLRRRSKLEALDNTKGIVWMNDSRVNLLVLDKMQINMRKIKRINRNDWRESRRMSLRYRMRRQKSFNTTCGGGTTIHVLEKFTLNKHSESSLTLKRRAKGTTSLTGPQ